MDLIRDACPPRRTPKLRQLMRRDSQKHELEADVAQQNHLSGGSSWFGGQALVSGGGGRSLQITMFDG